ncbi:hypothetical protein JEZ13_09545 [bacterium]|nr:hypothetical protein [bacterium]
MGLREVRAKLKDLEKNELVELIADLYKKKKPVKEYLDYKFKNDDWEFHDKYVKKLVSLLNPGFGQDVKLDEAQKLINDYKKFNPEPQFVADLMIIYLEVGMYISVHISAYDPLMLHNLHTMLSNVLQYCSKYDLLQILKERFKVLLVLSDDLIDENEESSWPFNEIVMKMINEYIPDLFEDNKGESDTQKKFIEFPKL